MNGKVLIVDDEPHIRSLVKHFLEKRGLETQNAVDGLEALRVAKEFSPDLILLDVQMPNMDGFEAARKMREDDELKNIPIIFLSALRNPDDKSLGFELGADDYIIKPFVGEDLVSRISSRLKHKLLEKEGVNQAKIETLSQLMVTIAHYINNALMAMQGFAVICDTNNPDQAAKLKETVENGSKKIHMVVESLREMAESGELDSQDYVGMKNAMFDIQERLAKKLEEVNS